MYIPKQYGKSKIDNCPFCNKRATTENKQGVPVCRDHKEKYLEWKCFCGSWLDIRKGKYGPFCTCIKCGIISFYKASQINSTSNKETVSNSSTLSSRSYNTQQASKPKKQIQAPAPYKPIKESKKETVITSDEVDFMY